MHLNWCLGELPQEPGIGFTFCPGFGQVLSKPVHSTAVQANLKLEPDGGIVKVELGLQFLLRSTVLGGLKKPIVHKIGENHTDQKKRRH